MRRLERPVGASPTTFMRPHWSPSFPRGYPERLLLSEYGKAPASSVLPEDVYFHHRWLRFEQSGPHPGTRNEAQPPATTRSLSARFHGMLLFPLPFGIR